MVTNICTPCTVGKYRAAGDNASHNVDTQCNDIICEKDYRVENNVCTPCELGKYNSNNDNAGGADTTCQAILCSENEHVVSNVCTPCTVGMFTADSSFWFVGLNVSTGSG